MQSDQLKYWIAFSRIPGIGRVRFKLLEERFASLEDAWQAGGAELQAAGLDKRTTQSITTRRPKSDPDAEIQHLIDNDVRAITWHDDDYPPRLKEIYDLPPVLYVKGHLLPEDERQVVDCPFRTVSHIMSQVPFPHDFPFVLESETAYAI